MHRIGAICRERYAGGDAIGDTIGDTIGTQAGTETRVEIRNEPGHASQRDKSVKRSASGERDSNARSRHAR